ncbi:nucleoside hydrolase-like domain-containing protein [Lunatimonas salinarum]|uniref:nucleoside hydrolase-like domain-containing protein n=1 Tax=Lunatimonas salinarum TaxID=1774590 RepID=UPI001ADFA084|nr:nucleoside hydrolase-like domain-containing protein [Lunatimonas salinarum]
MVIRDSSGIRFALVMAMVTLGVLHVKAQDKTRVFIMTDINIDSGDPDDRQSLVHLLWYADELEIEGVIPHRWESGALEACELAINAYKSDFQRLGLLDWGFQDPDDVRTKIAIDRLHGMELFRNAASEMGSPLYVLVWGNMLTLKEALFEYPELARNIRVVSIGTGLMLESNIPYMSKSREKERPCIQTNWNGLGRNEIYEDPRFDSLWWLEINWTYEGMFVGGQPVEMLQKLSGYGMMGKHLQEVVKKEAWAQYFRVGDTPSVLYVISPHHPLDDPTQSSWAGKFQRPFPDARPNYFTDYSGDLDWNYADPCASWGIHEQVKDIAVNTLFEQREEMYRALLTKLSELYEKK